MGVWLFLHAMVFTFGFLNYQLKGEPLVRLFCQEFNSDDLVSR